MIRLTFYCISFIFYIRKGIVVVLKNEIPYSKMLKRCATILFLYYTGYPPSGKGALKLSNLAHTDSMMNEIRELLLNARQRVAVQVNTELLSTYWNCRIDHS